MLFMIVFRLYLSKSTVVHTDYEPLKLIHNNAVRSQRLKRRSIELQSFGLEKKFISGSKNLLADYLSISNINNSDLS